MKNTRPHLLDDASRGVRCPGVALCADGSPAVGHRTWNQIARLGEFRGHPQGQFAFTPEVFGEIVRNFRATENGEVPVDFEHTSETLPPGTALHGIPAPAWIVDLDDRGKAGLWGLFDWKDPAAVEHVRAGRIKYVSPAVNFSSVHKVTGQDIGARLTSVALTNHPFLDGMAPLVASETAHSVTADQVIAALRSATPEQITTLSHTVRLGLAPGDVHVPTGVKVTPSNTRSPMDKFHKAFRAKFKLADDADEGAMMSALEKHLSEHEKLAKEHSELSEGEKKRKMAEAAQCADRARTDYGLPETALPMLRAQCMADRAAFDAAYPVRERRSEPSATDVLLTQRLTPQGGATTVPAAPGTIAASGFAEECDALANKLLSENPGRFPGGYSDAISVAEEQVTARNSQRLLNHMAAFNTGVR